MARRTAVKTRTLQEINPEDYEAVADALLKLHGAASGEYPAYVESYLDARSRRRGEVSLEEAFEASSVQIRAVDDLVEVAWTEVMSGAKRVGLSGRQIEFLKQRKDGLSIRDIAEVSGWSRSTVARDLTDAARLLNSIPAFGLWSVLAEIFRCSVYRIKAFLLH